MTRARAAGSSSTTANNLFDQSPTVATTRRAIDPVTNQPANLSVNNHFLPYSSFSPFGFNGRFLNARLSYQF